MTITQLSYVLAVAEHQNFTKAAQKCFVTQPTLSMQIQKLEDELDIIHGFETKETNQKGMGNVGDPCPKRRIRYFNL